MKMKIGPTFILSLQVIESSQKSYKNINSLQCLTYYYINYIIIVPKFFLQFGLTQSVLVLFICKERTIGPVSQTGLA